MPMRWRCPPENWCGYRLMYSGLSPTTSRSSCTRLRPRALGRDLGVDLVRLADDVADRHARVERGVRVLEDHLDVAADRLQGAAREAGDVLALVADLPAGGALQVDEHPGHRRLAAAGLADDAEGLALVQVEGDPVDRLDRADLAAEDDALGQREVLDQVVDLQDGFARRAGGLQAGAGQQVLGGRRLVAGGLVVAGGAGVPLALTGAGPLIGLHRASPSRSGRRSGGAGRPRRAAARRWCRPAGPAGSAGGRRSRAGWPAGWAAAP